MQTVSIIEAKQNEMKMLKQLQQVVIIRQDQLLCSNKN